VKVLVLSTAEEDLRSGFAFYDRNQPGLGAYFLECLFRDIDALRDQAGIHRVEGGYYRRLSDRFPCAIYYTIDEGTVKVWRILDLRRDPAWRQSELRRPRQ
jgi:plasmid stabilization system protein ParE